LKKRRIGDRHLPILRFFHVLPTPYCPFFFIFQACPVNFYPLAMFFEDPERKSLLLMGDFLIKARSPGKEFDQAGQSLL